MSGLARPGDAELRALAERVLSRDEYARWRRIETESALDLLQWLRGLLDRIDQLAALEPVLYWTLIGGLSLLALLLLTHVGWSVRSALRGGVLPAADAVRVSEALPDFAARAEQLAAQGQLLEAAHQLELGALQQLVEGGYLVLARHEPGRILRRRIARAGALPEALRAELVDALRTLERAWFRDRRADEALYARWQALHARLCALGPAPEDGTRAAPSGATVAVRA